MNTKNKELDKNIIMDALDWAYDKAISDVPKLGSAQKLAEEYMQGKGSVHDQANSLIKWQIAKAGTSGFVTGLGGVITLPVSIPANLTSIFYIQLKMIAAIAHMGGHDVKSDKVKTFTYMTLCGISGKEILKETGIQMGTKLTENAVKSISGKTLKEINKRIYHNFIIKKGTTGTINLGKCIPLVGGIIGGGIDAFTTKKIGSLAKNNFIIAEDIV